MFICVFLCLLLLLLLLLLLFVVVVVVVVVVVKVVVCVETIHQTEIEWRDIALLFPFLSSWLMKKFDCSFGVEKKKRTKKERTERSLFSPFHSEIIFQNAHQGTVLHNNTTTQKKKKKK